MKFAHLQNVCHYGIVWYCYSLNISIRAQLGGLIFDKSTRRKDVKGVAASKKSAIEIDFEEAASRDFALGGRYGNEIAKGLAVSTNPTAKLCGQMVREAMKKEYGPAYAA